MKAIATGPEAPMPFIDAARNLFRVIAAAVVFVFVLFVLASALFMLTGCSALMGGGDPYQYSYPPEAYDARGAYYPPQAYDMPASDAPAPTHPVIGATHPQPTQARAFSPAERATMPQVARGEVQPTTDTTPTPAPNQHSQETQLRPILPRQPQLDPVDTGFSLLEILGLVIPGVAGAAAVGRRVYTAFRRDAAFRRMAPSVHGAMFHGDGMDPALLHQALNDTDKQLIRRAVPPRPAPTQTRSPPAAFG